MMTLTMASRRADLNLNLTPPSDCEEDHVKEALKEAMLQHEIVFKHQLRELHRLYWTQKSLMNEFLWRRYDSTWADGKKSSALPAVNPIEAQSTTGKLHLANEFIRYSGKEIINGFTEEIGSGFCHSILATGHVEVNFSAVEAVNESFGHKSLADNAINTSHSQVTVSSGFGVETRMQNEGLEENGDCLNSDFLTEKRRRNKSVHIDLNIAQDDESVDVFPNTLGTFPSPSTSSSIVLHGVDLGISSINHSKASDPGNNSAKESTTTVQLGFAYPDSENSGGKMAADPLLYKPKASYRSSAHTSAQSSVIDSRNYNECTSDNEFHSSGITSSEECCKNLVERFCSTVSDGTHNVTDGTLLAKNYTSFSEPNVPILSGSLNNISISNSHVRNYCQYSAAGTTNLPTNNIAAGLEGKEEPREGSEEDTLSSHSIVPCLRQHDKPKKPPCGAELNQLPGDNECTSENRSVAEPIVVSNSESPGITHLYSQLPKMISSKTVANSEASGCICTEKVPCHFPPSKPKEHLEWKLADHIVVKAAETLVSISSVNPLCSADGLTNDRPMKPEFGEGNEQQQLESSDSFESITLKLEEIRDDASSICARQIDNGSRKEVSGFRLRRGRGIRDFQKDILPGIISLSRHEICEDLYFIKCAVKNKSCRTWEDTCFAPVKSRRSRNHTTGGR